MKIAGILLTIIGAIGLLITGINYANQTEGFNFLGLDVVVSEGEITPVIISGIILILGIVLTIFSKRNKF